MDVLLIFLSISGVVFAGVMIRLASRTARMERESDARVERLQSMATGSVLFAADVPAELNVPAESGTQAELDATIPPETPAIIDTLAPELANEPLLPLLFEHSARILAWDEFAGSPRAHEIGDNTDLDGIAFSDRPIDSRPPAAAPPPNPQPMPQPAPGHAFVLHVPEASREGRVFSFTRVQRRSTT